VDKGQARRLAKAGTGAGALLLLLAVVIKGLQGPYWWAILLFVLAVMLFLLAVLAMTYRFLSDTDATKVAVRPGSIEYEGPTPTESDSADSAEQSTADPAAPWWRRWFRRKRPSSR
jgi:hypothetical protein